MRIRIVMPVLNNSLLTAQAITSLREEGEFDLVVVDNGSDDDTLRMLESQGVTTLHNPDRGTYAKSVNMGAEGQWDALIVTNNDVIFGKDSIARLVHRCLQRETELVLPLSPRELRSAGRSLPGITRPSNIAEALANVDLVRALELVDSVQIIPHPYVPQGGYCFAISRRLWDVLGGMDEDYDLFGEDYDLFARACRHTKMIQARGAYVEHLEHQTVTWLGEERDVRMCRNRFRLAEKRDGLKELVSVIIPTYNRTDTLFEAIDSVLRQTMPHWKLYVIDDGSQDWDRMQQAAAQRYRGHEGRMWFFHRSRNEGPGAARNFGLSLSRGKYVAFLDSDDKWRPEHLETHLALHESNLGVTMSYSETDFAWRWWDSNAKCYRYQPDRHPEKQLSDWTYWPERLKGECFIKTSTVMLWGDLARSIRFGEHADHREPGAPAEDWDYFLSVQKAGEDSIAHIAKVTARTHWSKDPREESHHSSRLNPWADFGAAPAEWEARIHQPLDGAHACVAVIPTRDRPGELVRALDSLQGLPAVVVADGESSAAYAERAVDGREGVGLVILSQASGASAARNVGAALADSEWLWFLDDDDIALPGALALVEELDTAYSVTIGQLVTGACAGGLVMAPGDYTSAMFWRKEPFLRAGGFDERLAHAEERDLLARFPSEQIKRVPQLVAVKMAGSRKPKTVPLARAGVGLAHGGADPR